MMANFIYDHHDTFYILQFIADLILFVGIVIAMLSHKLPKYHEKPLYFVGFFALLSAFTIIATWLEGPIAGMSYSKIGIIPDTGMNVCLALVAAQLLWKTYGHKPEAPKKPTRKLAAKRRK
jgi:hypothetical protein